jgi:hypothetical protein
MGFDHRRQQFRCCGAARGHHRDGTLRGADAADGEEAGGAFIEMLPEPDFVTQRGEDDDERAVARAGANDEFLHAGGEHGLNDSGREGK